MRVAHSLLMVIALAVPFAMASAGRPHYGYGQWDLDWGIFRDPPMGSRSVTVWPKDLPGGLLRLCSLTRERKCEMRLFSDGFWSRKGVRVYESTFFCVIPAATATILAKDIESAALGERYSLDVTPSASKKLLRQAEDKLKPLKDEYEANRENLKFLPIAESLMEDKLEQLSAFKKRLEDPKLKDQVRFRIVVNSYEEQPQAPCLDEKPDTSR